MPSDFPSFLLLTLHCINLHFQRQTLGPSFLRECCPSLAGLDLLQESAWVPFAVNLFTHLCFEHFRGFCCGGWARNPENSPNHISALNSACRVVSFLLLLLPGWTVVTKSLHCISQMWCIPKDAEGCPRLTLWFSETHLFRIRLSKWSIHDSR